MKGDIGQARELKSKMLIFHLKWSRSLILIRRMKDKVNFNPDNISFICLLFIIFIYSKVIYFNIT